MKHTNLKVKDYLVSDEVFELKLSDKYEEMLFTSPTPNLNDLPNYYKSDEYISHNDNATGLINKIYYWVKQCNLKYKRNLIANDRKLKVLDYGCGTGEFVHYLNQNGFDAYGMEPNPKANEIASTKSKNKIYKNSDFLKDEKFDVIALYHVLEHIPNLEEEISKIVNALKPDGALFIAVPNYKSFDAEYYKEYWAAYDVPRHLWHFTENSIKDIFSRFGMIIDNTYPMWFDSFYISLISERYKKNKFGIFVAPLIGLLSNLKAMKNNQYSSKIYKMKKEKLI